jgi:hypothetical protein
MQIDHVSAYQTMLLLLTTINTTVSLDDQDHELIQRIIEKMNCIGQGVINKDYQKYEAKKSCEGLIRWLGNNQLTITGRIPQSNLSLHQILLNMSRIFKCDKP